MSDCSECPRCRGTGVVPINSRHQQALDLLREKSPKKITAREMAEALGIKATAAHMRLTWLENEGLARRVRDGLFGLWTATGADG